MSYLILLLALAGCADWEVDKIPSNAVMNSKTGCYHLKPEITSHPDSTCSHGISYDLTYGSGVSPVLNYCGDPRKLAWPEWKC